MAKRNSVQLTSVKLVKFATLLVGLRVSAVEMLGDKDTAIGAAVGAGVSSSVDVGVTGEGVETTLGDDDVIFMVGSSLNSSDGSGALGTGVPSSPITIENAS